MISKLSSRIAHLLQQLQEFLVAKEMEEPKPRFSHFPYISGDTFLAFSDIAIMQNGDRKIIKPHSMPSILFIEGSQIESEAIQQYSKSFRAVLMHNSDITPSDFAVRFFEENCIHLFATNTRPRGEYIHYLPIGLENVHHCRNGSLHYYYPGNQLLENPHLSKTITILVSFSISTNIKQRSYALQICEKYGHYNCSFKSLKSYRAALRRSSFVISPPGNGIDCHRTWEAIYSKAIPVIERKYYLYRDDTDLPIYVCDSYDDFFSMTEDQRSDLYQSILSKSYPAVYADYWFDRIRMHARVCKF